ncbi:ScbR family autoregulator-binding transcription factor [Amycolatopsis mongoliensis]|uniref:ScbR family autoregulator-binding transcription factor n=1 Tax=Amycolatopsis mongoliensis TaxID=715475 RepID=A0A9Y2JLU6_9PSEU|nr:ScbR family autoregulator-binding transcription factor [Amycolatopsis sp. 4-36]WIY00868.1 ScbR family autoregulator-binding transcription factor [Amycolatopsis sp. 4-36]
MTGTARGRRTREELVDAAAAIFDRDGFAGTTLDTVCAEAEVTKGALYCHFPSKAALAAAVVERYCPLWWELAARLSARYPSPAQVLVELTFEVARRLQRDPAYRASVRLPLHAELADLLAPAHFLGWLAVVRELLRRARRAGELRGDVDVRTAAESTVAEFAGTHLVARATAGEHDLVARVGGMWRQRLPGLVAPETWARLSLDPPGADPEPG